MCIAAFQNSDCYCIDHAMKGVSTYLLGCPNLTFFHMPILCFNAESWSCRHLVLLKSTQHKDSGQYWDWNIYHSGVSTAPVTFSTIQEGWGLIKLNFQWIGLICNVNIFLLAYNYILGVLNLLHITFFLSLTWEPCWVSLWAASDSYITNLVCWYSRQPILVLYACFGLSYFYYDVLVMFIGAYLEDKQEDPQRSLRYIWTKFYRKKKLIIIHHVLLPIVGFPAVTVSVLKFVSELHVFW